MNKKYKLDQLVSMLRDNYPHYPHLCTFSFCYNKDNGCKNLSRGGGECPVCIENKLSQLVGHDLAVMMHAVTAQASMIYCEMVAKVEHKGGIQNVY